MNTATKHIVVYTGRFQPFGPHHYQTYLHLCGRFGVNNVFITTTDSTTDKSKNPLNFAEKSVIIQNYGIPKTQICRVTSNYKSTELLDHFDLSKYAVIFAYGEKDAGRINYVKSDGSPSYFMPYDGQLQLQPANQRGYVYIAPKVNIELNGEEMNGTLLRKILPYCDRERFKEVMGWYSLIPFNICKQKFTESVLTEEKAITKTQLQRIEQYADRLFKEFGIDIEFQDIYRGTHFFQRLNDPRNGTQITTDELRGLFRKVSQKYGDKINDLPPNAEGVLRDMESDVNMPFVIKYDKANREIDLIPKTIMRKSDFKSVTPFYTVESAQPYTRHICHPFEAENLTYGELLDMVKHLCENPADLSPTVKLDGLNCQFTVVGGSLRASRNKSTTTAPMNRAELAAKFNDNPPVQEAFLFAYDAVKGWVSENKLEKTLQNGVFVNVEICVPNVTNVFSYGKIPQIFVHGLIKYDQTGNKVSEPYLPTTVKYNNTVKSTPVPTLKSIDPTPYLNQIVQLAVKTSSTTASPIRNTEELQDILYKFGSEFLKKSFSGSVNSIISRLSEIEDAITPDLQEKYETNMARFNRLGGISTICPCEGIVFGWNGSKYKLTGTFGILNKILNLTKYNAKGK